MHWYGGGGRKGQELLFIQQEDEGLRWSLIQQMPWEAYGCIFQDRWLIHSGLHMHSFLWNYFSTKSLFQESLWG